MKEFVGLKAKRYAIQKTTMMKIKKQNAKKPLNLKITNTA